MNRPKIVYQLPVLALVVVLVATAAWPVQALGLSPAKAAIILPQGSPLVIPAAAFSSDGFSPESYFFSFFGGYMRGTGTGDGCVKAPVNLPKWATLNEVYVSAYDNDPARDLYIDVRRVDNFTGAAITMASMKTSLSATYVQSPYDFTISGPLIDTTRYAYYVTMCLGSTNIRLYSVRLWYSGPYNLALPFILMK